MVLAARQSGALHQELHHTGSPEAHKLQEEGKQAEPAW